MDWAHRVGFASAGYVRSIAPIKAVASRMQTKFSLYLFYYVSSTRDVEARAGEFDRGEKRAKLHGNPTVRNEPSYAILEP